MTQEPKESHVVVSPRGSLRDFPSRTDAGTYKEITADQARFLVSWAKAYGLDAWLGHVCFIFGKPYFQVSGRIFNAHRSRMFGGMATRPLGEEAVTHAGFKPGDYVWEAEVWRKDWDRPVVELGVVTQEEIERLKQEKPESARFLPVVKVPSLMAEKRALARALDRAFPLGLDLAEEMPQTEETS